MEKSTPKAVKELLVGHGLRLKKRFGQNFLIDDGILKKIMRTAALDEDTLVIEIGPGLGSLTRYLFDAAGHVLAIEIDDNLVEVLEETFGDVKNLTLLHEDVLKVDLDEEIEKLDKSYGKVVVVANLPYYITTPFITNCLEKSERIDRYVLMVQLEVARRLTARPSTKDYNALSVFIHYHTEAEFCFRVPREVFIPKPEVGSAVINLKVKDRHDVPRETSGFHAFIRNAFAQRRKTLVNNLHSAYGVDKVETGDFLEKMGYDRNIRAERIEPDGLVDLAREFFAMNTDVPRENKGRR